MALTLVAPGVLLSALEILVTPALAFAIVLSRLTSSLLHSRRTIFFLVFLAISAPSFGSGLLSRQIALTMTERLSLRGADANGSEQLRRDSYHAELWFR